MPKCNYRLNKLELYLSLGEIDDKGLPDPLDNRSYCLIVRPQTAGDGLPHNMLSNLRFNVLRKFDHVQKELVLQVVPQTLGGVDMKTLRKASFFLTMADIIP